MQDTSLAPPETPVPGAFSLEELQLATRNHGMPLEALAHELTPVGLHYLLIHFDIPVADADGWLVDIGGRVDRPLSLSLDDLRSRRAVTHPVTLECAGNGRARLTPRPISQPWLLEAVGTAAWTGTPLRPLLEEAGLADDAVDVVFTGLDRGVEGGAEQHYERALSRDDALRDDVVLAYEMNGQPLPPQHGFPLRLVVPGWYGMASVKWLTGVTVIDHTFTGYQHTKAYRFRDDEDDPGKPVTRIYPRSLMVPPGIPDYMTRRRFVPAGDCQVRGRAWSGWAEVTAVEVSIDGGRTWEPAALNEAPGPHAWRPWTYTWAAQPGEYEVCCRATDAAGNRQPVDHAWNAGGYAGNAVQRVTVSVTADRAGEERGSHGS